MRLGLVSCLYLWIGGGSGDGTRLKLNVCMLFKAASNYKNIFCLSLYRVGLVKYWN